MLPVIEGLARPAARAPRSRSTPPRPRSPRRRWTPARRIVNDVTALRGDPEMAAVVAAARRRLLPDAHARRAAHDAARPALRRRRRRRQGVPGGADGVRRRRGDRRGADPARPRDRLRQDGRAQPRAAARGSTSSSRSAGRSSIGTSRKSFLGRITGRAGRRSGWPATIATNVLAYERGARVFRVHDVAPVARCAARSRLLRSARRWPTTTTTSTTTTTTTRTTTRASEPDVTIEITGLSLYTHSGVTAAEREVGQRLLLDLRLDVGESDATVTDRDRGHRRLRRRSASVALVAQQRSYKTLERLCAAIADRLLDALRGAAPSGSRRPSPSRRSRCRSTRSRSRCGARRE